MLRLISEMFQNYLTNPKHKLMKIILNWIFDKKERVSKCQFCDTKTSTESYFFMWRSKILHAIISVYAPVTVNAPK